MLSRPLIRVDNIHTMDYLHEIENYAYLVPFIESKEKIILKNHHPQPQSNKEVPEGKG